LLLLVGYRSHDPLHNVTKVWVVSDKKVQKGKKMCFLKKRKCWLISPSDLNIFFKKFVQIVATDIYFSPHTIDCFILVMWGKIRKARRVSSN